MTGHDPATPAASAARRIAVALPALVLAAHLLSPALTATHVEGYTASLQLDAIAAQRGLIARADLLYPVQTEYLYLTRQGVVLLLRGLIGASGSTGDVLFRALTLASLAVFLAATAVLARRHAPDLRWAPTLAALAVLPGLFELGFHFSDGLVAVGLGIAGLALLPGATAGPGWVVRSALAGAALAAAVLCRADALLLLPLALGLAWLEQRRLPQLVLLAAVGAAGMLAVFAAAQALSGTTLLDALRVGRFFDLQHGGSRIAFVRALVFVLFFGIPGLVFGAIGVVRGWQLDAAPQRRAVLIGMPVLVLAYALHKSTETRQVYPYLAPFAVIACARGLQWALQRRRRALPLLTAAAAVWLLPPVFVPVKDGPRAVFGRVWSPPLWRTWQGRVDASLADVDALLARAETLPRMVLVSAHFNPDHYLQLRAWQRGWLPLRPDETADRCGGGVEVWARSGREIVLIRLDNTYGLSALEGDDYTAVHLREALACKSIAGAPAHVADFWPPLSGHGASAVLREGLPASPPMAHVFGWPAPLAHRVAAAWGRRHLHVPLAYGIGRSAALDGSQLQRAAQAAERRIAETEARTGERLPPMDVLLGRFGTRYWAMPALEPSALPGAQPSALRTGALPPALPTSAGQPQPPPASPTPAGQPQPLPAAMQAAPPQPGTGLATH